jgi:hypothetical protein
MPVEIPELKELIDKQSPGQIEVSPGSSESYMFFIIQEDSEESATQKLFTIIPKILGRVKRSTKIWANNTRGGLERELAMVHPFASWMSADTVEIQGIKSEGNAESETYFPTTEWMRDVDYQTMPYFQTYNMYRLKVNFSAKNYLELNDAQLENAIAGPGGFSPKKYKYWVPDVNRNPPFADKDYYDFREYLRFTEMFVEPNNELIANTAGRGFWMSLPFNQAVPKIGAPAPNSVITLENAPINFQNITKNIVKIKWYKIPYNTINFDYIKLNAGQVNYGPNWDQDAGDFTTFNYPFFGYKAGTLLYTGYKIEDIKPQFPFPDFSVANRRALYSNYVDNLMCTMVFNFVQFVIPEDQIVYPDSNSVQFTNYGKMLSGWNMAPVPSKRFFYVENKPIGNKFSALPPYWSYPFQNLFSLQTLG